MIEKAAIVMYERADDIQEYYKDRDNRAYLLRYYQYPGIGNDWEVMEQIGYLHGHNKYYLSTLTEVVWLPEIKYLEAFIPHKDLIELDSKFSDFKAMFYESHWFTNDVDSLEGRGRDPLDCFKTYDELWLGFVMMDRYRKRWDGKSWKKTDIYPDYFKMEPIDALRNGYPDPLKLCYVAGLRGYTERY